MGDKNYMSDLLTDSIEWADIAKHLFNGQKNDACWFVNLLYDTFDKAQEIVKYVNEQGDIGSLYMPVMIEDLESFDKNRRKLLSFSNAIHYEIYELVDKPFCLRLSDTADKAFHLNPSDIKVTTGKSILWKENPSLTDLLVTTVKDNKLKKDFETRYKALDKDKPSKTLSEAMKEAKFWDSEFKKSDICKKIAEEIFTQDVRDNWGSYTVNKRKSIIEKYVNKIGQFFYGQRSQMDRLQKVYPSIVKSVDYTLTKDGAFGVARPDDTLGINYRFVSDPIKDYSVDNLIDTLTHEIRHHYQDAARSNPDKYGVPEDLRKKWDGTKYKSVATYGYDAYYKQELERDARAFAAVSRPSN